MAAPHGHTKHVWLGNTLQIECFGPFNEEASIIALDTMQSAILERIDKLPFWQRIDILNYETIGSPKVMRMIGHSYLWSFSQGCNAIATVYSNHIQKTMLVDFTAETNANIKGFDNQESAVEWLKDQHKLYFEKISEN